MPALRYQPQAIGYFLEAGLTGNIGSRAFDLSDLGNWDSRRYSIGPTLYLPIFQGGRLESKLALNETRHRLARVACLQTVLRAWHEVDDALNAYATESRRHRQLQRPSRRTRRRRSSQIELAECSTAAALSVASLYRALGGGWSADLSPETEPADENL